MPELYRLSVGPMHAAYYQEQFHRFEALGRTMPSWNHGAAFFTLAWLVLRKLWRPALIYAAFLLTAIAVWAFVLHARVPIQVEAAACLLSGLLLCAIPGLFANGWYYNHVRKQTLDTLSRATSLSHARTLLAQHSPDKRRLQVIALMQALLSVILAAWLYQQRPSDSEHDNAGSTPASLVIPAPARLPQATQPSASIEEELTEATAMQNPVNADVLPSAPPLSTTPIQQRVTSESFSEHNKPTLAAASTTSQEVQTPRASAQTTAAKTKVESTNGKKTPSTSLIPGKYYLNAGVYAQASNVERATQKLQAAQFQVLRQTVSSKQGTLTRLRIGPFNSPQQAQQAATKAQKLGIETSVFLHTNS